MATDPYNPLAPRPWNPSVPDWMNVAYGAQKAPAPVFTPAVIDQYHWGKVRARTGYDAAPPERQRAIRDESVSYTHLDVYKRQPQKQESSGSGVIVSADGFIVTNNHVVEGAEELEVVMSNKRTYKAKVIGTDPSTDIAVIQIPAKDLPSLAFGNSDAIKVGEWVVAVGNLSLIHI